MDPARFPTTAAYLARLPEGLRSHPDCLVKASVLRDILHSRPLAPEDVAGAPDAIRELIEHPLPVSTWVPEVFSVAAMTMARDRFFVPGDEGLRQYEQWTYDRNRRLLSRRLYRPLFRLVSPTRLLRNASRLWGSFRRGTQLVLTDPQPGRVRLQLGFPSHLHDDVASHGVQGMLRAVTELAGGHDVTCRCLSTREFRSEFELRYR